MSKKSRIQLLAIAVLAALVISLGVTVAGVYADGDEDRNKEMDQGQDQALPLPEKTGLKYPNLGSHLDGLVVQVEEEETTSEDAASDTPVHSGESVAVTIHLSGNVDEVVQFLEDNGGDPRNVGEDYIEAYVSVTLLGQLSEQPGVIRVREIIPPEPAQTSQRVAGHGPPVHGSLAWNRAGYTGQGVKVGIIGAYLAFNGFGDLMGTELPSTVQARCYTDIGRFTTNLADCEDAEAGGNHGTLVAEALVDIAPEVSLYIASPPTRGDFRSAVDWMVSEGVKVIVRAESSIFDGPGDGTSPFSASPLRIVDRAVAGGVVWVNAAGNHALRTWFARAPFGDSDGDGFIEFSVFDEVNDITLEAGDQIRVQLRWDDSWGGAATDLDLGIQNEAGQLVAFSIDPQSGAAGHIPMEFIAGNVLRRGEYGVVVEHVSGSVPDWIQLMVWGPGSIQHHTKSGSITNPAESANPGMLAVGAAHWNDVRAIEFYSSRGPTPDGRVKPDIVGADCGATALRPLNEYNEGFCGTSQAAPHVAGMAALVRQRFPGYTPAQVAGYLKDNAEQRQSPDPNNTWGHGFAKLPPPDGTVLPVPTPSNAFTRNPAADFNTLAAADNGAPGGIWSDGTTMWVADWIDGKIYAYDLATKARVPGKDLDTLIAAGNTWPGDIWSDGTTMWVTHWIDDKIYAYDLATKVRVPGKDFDTLEAAGNQALRGIWSDGTTMWVADWIDGKIYAYDLATKARVPGKDFDTLKSNRNLDPESIWSDGTTMWVVDDRIEKIYAYDMATRARIPDKEFNTLEAAGNEESGGIWSDGTTMWVADWIDNKIYAYRMPQAVSTAHLEVSPVTAVPNQAVTVTGRGFTSGATINAANDGSMVRVGNSAMHLQSGTRNFNSGQEVTISSGGTWSASLIIPITTATTSPGTHMVEVEDSGNRSGSVEITIPERTLTIEPAEARPGEWVTLTGSGFPSDNGRSKEQSTPSVSIMYADDDVGTARPDSSGTISLRFVVPLDAAIPSTNRVEAVYTIPGTSTLVRASTNHEVPGVRIQLSMDEGKPGDSVTVTGDGFKASSLVEYVRIGGIEVTPAPRPATDRNGEFTATILVPDLANGTYAVNVSVSGVTASANFTVSTPRVGVTASAARSFSPATVAPGGRVTVTITAANYGLLGAVTETLPAGFIYLSSTHGSVTHPVDGNSQIVRFTLQGETSFTYTVTASDVEGSYTFSGTLRDFDRNDHTVGGASTVTVSSGDPLVARYDANKNGTIEKSEVIKAINDYLFGTGDDAPSKADVIRLINLYLFG